jgi:hypothetical protein
MEGAHRHRDYPRMKVKLPRPLQASRPPVSVQLVHTTLKDPLKKTRKSGGDQDITRFSAEWFYQTIPARDHHVLFEENQTPPERFPCDLYD